MTKRLTLVKMRAYLISQLLAGRGWQRGVNDVAGYNRDCDLLCCVSSARTWAELESLDYPPGHLPDAVANRCYINQL